MNGKEYNLFKNNGGTAPNFLNSLHGGKRGFDKYNWSVKQIANGIEMTMTSADGDEGYPGKLDVTVQYVLEGNAFSINYQGTELYTTLLLIAGQCVYKLLLNSNQNHFIKLASQQKATSDADTIVNLTNHAYFNLDGHSAWGNLDNHSIVLNADHYTPVDDNAIPTGQVEDLLSIA